MQPGDSCRLAASGVLKIWMGATPGWQWCCSIFVSNHPYEKLIPNLRNTKKQQCTNFQYHPDCNFTWWEIGVGNPQHFDPWRCYFFLVTLKKLTLGENLLRDEFFGITRCICDDAMIFVLYIIFSICTVFRVFRITLSGAEMVFWPCQASIWPCRLFWLMKLKQGNWYIGMIVIITCHRKNRGQKSAEVVKKTSPTTGRTPTRWFSGDVWSEPEADVCNQKDCWLEWWLASEISEIMGSDVVVSKYF